MIDVLTKTKLEVPPHGIGPSAIIVGEDQVDTLRTLFDAHGIIYEVSEEYLEEEGDPTVAFIYFSRRTDPVQVQKLIDGIR